MSNKKTNKNLDKFNLSKLAQVPTRFREITFYNNKCNRLFTKSRLQLQVFISGILNYKLLFTITFVYHLRCAVHHKIERDKTCLETAMQTW